MLTISIDELEHMEDPIAALVWKRWIRQGKARLLETQGSGKKVPEKKLIQPQIHISEKGQETPFKNPGVLAISMAQEKNPIH
jgi:hypothetical protein